MRVLRAKLKSNGNGKAGAAVAAAGSVLVVGAVGCKPAEPPPKEPVKTERVAESRKCPDPATDVDHRKAIEEHVAKCSTDESQLVNRRQVIETKSGKRMLILGRDDVVDGMRVAFGKKEKDGPRYVGGAVATFGSTVKLLDPELGEQGRENGNTDNDLLVVVCPKKHQSKTGTAVRIVKALWGDIHCSAIELKKKAEIAVQIKAVEVTIAALRKELRTTKSNERMTEIGDALASAGRRLKALQSGKLLVKDVQGNYVLPEEDKPVKQIPKNIPDASTKKD